MTFALRFVNGRPLSAMARQGPIRFGQILPHAFPGDIIRLGDVDSDQAVFVSGYATGAFREQRIRIRQKRERQFMQCVFSKYTTWPQALASKDLHGWLVIDGCCSRFAPGAGSQPRLSIALSGRWSEAIRVAGLLCIPIVFSAARGCTQMRSSANSGNRAG